MINQTAKMIFIEMLLPRILLITPSHRHPNRKSWINQSIKSYCSKQLYKCNHKTPQKAIELGEATVN